MRRYGDGSDTNQRLTLLLEHFENVLHDIRTPISIIYLTAQSIERTRDLPEELREPMRLISKHCLQVIRQINDTSDYDKIVNGRFKPRLFNYDIVSLLEGFVVNTRPLAARKNIGITLSCCHKPKIISTDRDFIERILLNLVSNAVKFSANDSTIRISMKDETTRIVIEVADRGVGFKPEQLDSMFKRYETYGGYMNHNGSGIGLSLVREMADALGGEVWAAPGDDGVGASVSLALPCAVISGELPADLTEGDSLFPDMVQTALAVTMDE